MQSVTGIDTFSARRLYRQFPRIHRLPLALIVILAVLLAMVVSSQGIANLSLGVKLAALGVIGAAVGALLYARPLLFPLCAYIFAVPFDTLLQTGPGTITKFLGLASAAVMVIVLTDRRRVLGAPAAAVPWIAYLAWSVASYMWSAVPMYRNELLSANIELFAIFLIAAMIRIGERELWFILGAALAGGTAFAAFGIWIFRSAPSTISGSGSERLAIQLNTSSYVNADHFSAALIMPIALGLVAMLHFKGWRKILCAAALLVLFGGAFVSGTRGSFIAIVIMWVYLMIVNRRRIELIAIAAAGLLASIAFPNVWIRFTDPGQGEAGGRYAIWGIAWDAFRQRPLFGIGADQFRIAYSQSYLANAHGTLITRWVQDPHNLIVSNAVELGIIGLVLVLAAWFFQFRIVSAIPRSSPLFDARIAIEAGTLGLFINSLSVDLMFYKYLWVAFMLGAFVRSAYVSQTPARRRIGT
jgi:O-antigen ligase